MAAAISKGELIRDYRPRRKKMGVRNREKSRFRDPVQLVAICINYYSGHPVSNRYSVFK